MKLFTPQSLAQNPGCGKRHLGKLFTNSQNSQFCRRTLRPAVFNPPAVIPKMPIFRLMY